MSDEILTADGRTGRVFGRARVKLEIEIPVGDGWGADCDLAQVFMQGRRSAVASVEKALAPLGARVLSSQVTAILAVEPR